MAIGPNAIATEDEARRISRSYDDADSNKCCTYERASELGCLVQDSGDYAHNSLVKHEDLYAVISQPTDDLPAWMCPDGWQFEDNIPRVQLLSVYHTPLETRWNGSTIVQYSNSGTTFFEDFGGYGSELLGDLEFDPSDLEPLEVSSNSIYALASKSPDVDILFRVPIDYFEDFAAGEPINFPVHIYLANGDKLEYTIHLRVRADDSVIESHTEHLADQKVKWRWCRQTDCCYVFLQYHINRFSYDKKNLLATDVVLGNVVVSYDYDSGLCSEHIRVFKNGEPVEVFPYPRIVDYQNASDLLVTDMVTSFETAGNINVINLGPYDDDFFVDYSDYTIDIDIPYASSPYSPIVTLHQEAVNMEGMLVKRGDLVQVTSGGFPVPEEKVAHHNTPAGMVEGINDYAGQIVAWPLEYLFDNPMYTLSGLQECYEEEDGLPYAIDQHRVRLMVGMSYDQDIPQLLGITLNGKTYQFLLVWGIENYLDSVMPLAISDPVSMANNGNPLGCDDQFNIMEPPHEVNEEWWFSHWNDVESYSLRRQMLPNMYNQDYEEKAECVAPGTKVLVDDNGTCKNVEDLKVGDLIITDENGQMVSTTIDKIVETQHNYYIRITLYNKTILHISMDHAIQTQDGWKAFMPKLTSTPEDVKPLRRTDSIMTTEGLSKIAYISVIYNPITMYNLGLSGHNDYYANGVLVHECADSPNN